MVAGFEESKRLLITLVALMTPLGASEPVSKDDGTPSSVVAQIDDHLQVVWDTAGVVPAVKSSDEEFLRRVWLDLAGVSPPVGIVRRFVSDSSSAKRELEIDRLLGSPRHAAHMADLWQNILLPETMDPQMRAGASGLREWLRNQFLDNLGYDHFVASFLTAGGQSQRGPAVFYTALEVEPKKLAAATSQIFLAQQLKCAECHDHPTDRWTQDDFWRFTAFFGQLNQRTAGGETYIEDTGTGEVTLPESDEVVEPMYPGGLKPESDPDGNRRRQLTIWMASRDNPYLPRAIVNRVWSQLFGRGQVEPVDVMDEANPAAQPAILDLLVEDLLDHRFDLRRLYGILMRTKAYQLSSVRGPGEAEDIDSSLFARMNVKTLTAEQFYDSLAQNVLRTPPQTSQGQFGLSAMREQFIGRMRASGATAREYPHGVVQALGLMNGPEVSQGVTFQSSGLLQSLEAPFFDDSARIETLFLATLSRRPTKAEQERFGEYLAGASDQEARRKSMGDILWALVNSSEFATCP